MNNKATLNNLIAFVPENDAEREIFDSCKKDVLNDYLKDSIRPVTALNTAVFSHFEH